MRTLMRLGIFLTALLLLTTGTVKYGYTGLIIVNILLLCTLTFLRKSPKDII